ncbi:MAG: hypothetical protein FWC89_13945, partial [Defluviitaleaceae bacterium]|nr:hypothetical protein [Defluviitaleaceae bacterium]
MNGGFAEHRNKIIFFILLAVAIIAFLFLRSGDGSPLRFREIDIATADAIPVVLPEGSYAAFLHYHSNAGTQSGN